MTNNYGHMLIYIILPYHVVVNPFGGTIDR